MTSNCPLYYSWLRTRDSFDLRLHIYGGAPSNQRKEERIKTDNSQMDNVQLAFWILLQSFGGNDGYIKRVKVVLHPSFHICPRHGELLRDRPLEEGLGPLGISWYFVVRQRGVAVLAFSKSWRRYTALQNTSLVSAIHQDHSIR